jgi:hypothetical protein
VAQHVGHQVGHVLGQHVAAAAQQASAARAFDQPMVARGLAP